MIGLKKRLLCFLLLLVLPFSFSAMAEEVFSEIPFNDEPTEITEPAETEPEAGTEAEISMEAFTQTEEPSQELQKDACIPEPGEEAPPQNEEPSQELRSEVFALEPEEPFSAEAVFDVIGLDNSAEIFGFWSVTGSPECEAVFSGYEIYYGEERIAEYETDVTGESEEGSIPIVFAVSEDTGLRLTPETEYACDLYLKFVPDCAAYFSGAEEDVLTVRNSDKLVYVEETGQEIPAGRTVFETMEDLYALFAETEQNYAESQTENKEEPTDEIEIVEIIENSDDTDIIDDNEIALFGDVNGDGILTSGDIVALKALILGKFEASEEMLLTADINGDGEISSGDLAKLKVLTLKIE